MFNIITGTLTKFRRGILYNMLETKEIEVEGMEETKKVEKKQEISKAVESEGAVQTTKENNVNEGENNNNNTPIQTNTNEIKQNTPVETTQEKPLEENKKEVETGEIKKVEGIEENKEKEEKITEIEEKKEEKTEETAEKLSENNQDNTTIDNNFNKNIKIEFLYGVPTFLGPDLSKYGPFQPGETIELPKQLADILIEKGRAKEIKNQ